MAATEGPGRGTLARIRERQEAQLAAALWRADRPLAAAWWALLTARGLLPAGFAIVTGALVAAVEHGSGLAGPLVAVAVVFLLMQVLGPLHTALSANLGDRTAAWLYDELAGTTPTGSRSTRRRPGSCASSGCRTGCWTASGSAGGGCTSCSTRRPGCASAHWPWPWCWRQPGGVLGAGLGPLITYAAAAAGTAMIAFGGLNWALDRAAAPAAAVARLRGAMAGRAPSPAGAPRPRGCPPGRSASAT